MNCCHGNNNENRDNGRQGHRHGGHMGHMLMMALCCGAPVIILLLVPFIARIGGSGTASFMSRVVPYMCPLMMLFMIPMMLKGGKGSKDSKECHGKPELELEEKTRPENKASS